MIWNGKTLETVGDLNDAICSIRRGDPATRKEQAAQFMRQYRAETEHADTNIGYITGYHGPETMRELQDLFDVGHPIFGRSQPVAEDAFDAGAMWGSGIEPEPI